jgi:hypothetical protein
MKVAFHSNQLGLRGTEIALYDYAFYNQHLLGNESIIYCRRSGEVHPAVHRKFAAQFECVFYDEFRDLESISSRRDVRHTYFIKAGPRDGQELAATRNLVHAVFPTAAEDFHGDRFAFVSEWLAEECSNCRLPFVPHMVDLPDHPRDLRAELNLPADAMVYGCYGGRDSFDIGFVREVVARAETLVPHAFFLFMNIERFCSHSRVLFLPGTSCLERKVSFINSCDAMLHARHLGESFGLACAEFSIRNRPVVTYGFSSQRSHLHILGDAAFVYRDRKELIAILRGMDRNACRRQAWDRYSSSFSPRPVMEKFREVFLNGARQEQGLNLWDQVQVQRHRVARKVRTLNERVRLGSAPLRSTESLIRA